MPATGPTDADPVAYLESVPNERRRRDGLSMLSLMRDVTGLPGVMWGPSMVGFGTYTYHYASGRAGEWFVLGFAPRSSALTLYGIHHDETYGRPADLSRLGPHTTGKGCVYIKDLSQIDEGELRRLVTEAWDARESLNT